VRKGSIFRCIRLRGSEEEIRGLFAWGIEEKGERAAGRERFRDSEGVGLRANSPLRRGPGQFDRTPDAFALSARKIAS
jgi:hypothetical protein